MNKQILAKLQSGKPIEFTIRSLRKITLKQAVMAVIVQDEALDIPDIQCENNVIRIDFDPEDEAALVVLIYASDLCSQKRYEIRDSHGVCIRSERYADKIIRLFEQFNALHLDVASTVIERLLENEYTVPPFDTDVASYAGECIRDNELITITEDHLRDMTLPDMFALFYLESDNEISSNLILPNKPNIVKCEVRCPWVVTMFLTTWIHMSTDDCDDRIKINGKRYNLSNCCPGFVELVTNCMIEGDFICLRPCQILLSILHENPKIPNWDKLILDELEHN